VEVKPSQSTSQPGNTVVVVEHDPAAMRAADWMVELARERRGGGALVYQGPAAGVRGGTLTGQYLSARSVSRCRRRAVRRGAGSR